MVTTMTLTINLTRIWQESDENLVRIWQESGENLRRIWQKTAKIETKEINDGKQTNKQTKKQGLEGLR